MCYQNNCKGRSFISREVQITSSFVSLYVVAFYVCFSIAGLNNLSLTVQVYFAERKKPPEL